MPPLDLLPPAVRWRETGDGLATIGEVAPAHALVLGGGGLVGSALIERLAHEKCRVTIAQRGRDLRKQADVERVFCAGEFDVVFLAAAKVGGIIANDTRPAEFAYDNIAIAANVIDAAARFHVRKLVFLGSSCIYPRDAANPIAEDALLTGPLEPTNRSYAVAKIAGIELCQAYRRQYGCDFISVMPPNIYGERDRFDDVRGSHVMAALIRRIVQAKRDGVDGIAIWGTGTPRREFMHAEDLADALIFLAKNYSSAKPINVGWGRDIAIYDLARLIADEAGWSGGIYTDASKPDGTPCKTMDVSRITELGWQPRIGLREGIRRTLKWYQENSR